MSSNFSCVIMGGNSMPLQCAETLLRGGHSIRGAITADPVVTGWMQQRGIPTIAPQADVVAFASALPAFDYLFSIVNDVVAPPQLLQMATRCAINFHDALLPKYAGYNATTWAILNNERNHGITWHVMEAKVDAGAVLKQNAFPVDGRETAFTLNAHCFEAGINGFGELIQELAGNRAHFQQQQLDQRTYVGRFKRPYAACLLSPYEPAEHLDRLCRAVDFGRYWNPFGIPKFVAGGSFWLVGGLTVLDSASGSQPGTIAAIDERSLRITTATNDIEITELQWIDGRKITIEEFCRETTVVAGARLPELDHALGKDITELHEAVARYEPRWVKRLLESKPPQIGKVAVPAVTGRLETIEIQIPATWSSANRQAGRLISALAGYCARLTGDSDFLLGKAVNETLQCPDVFASVVPMRIQCDGAGSFEQLHDSVTDEIEQITKYRTFLRDLPVREPGLRSRQEAANILQFGITVAIAGGPTPMASDLGNLHFIVAEDGAACTWRYNSAVHNSSEIQHWSHQFSSFLAHLAKDPSRPLNEVSIVNDDEREKLLVQWNSTERSFDADACIHQLFEAQAKNTPESVAVTFEGNSLTYAELDRRSNQFARFLRGEGVGRETLVGVCLPRSLELMVVLMGILKAGGAYVPLDPSYPQERLALIVEDAQPTAIVTCSAAADKLPPRANQQRSIVIDLEAEAITGHSDVPLQPLAVAEDLAYVIYTSGSTGKPKGVMVTHRNVSNFFTGMDERIGEDKPGVWLAVTSISFDISALELFWTLTRGFHVVIAGEQSKLELNTAGAGNQSAGKMDFSLFYFATNEGTDGDNKYRLLLEGARFADKHGFSAVWTPERHFHSFGGLYPNPSVTSAAVAAVTQRIAIRAGSVVLPLHNPIRVAEEWSIVDNLSNGRVGISFASGWNERDFVFAPENYAENKKVMLRNIETVRSLWRGESVTTKDGKGQEVAIQILPRPVQPELPVWITAAGSPDTFAAAGAKGYNLLTHLLGQTVEQVAEKIAVYRQARRDNGHDPDTGHVTIMLHTFVGESIEAVREKVREPFTNYLRTSLDLIKKAPWSFPVFAKRPGATAANIDLSQLSTEEMDALLGHAFDRYFETSGLFGTPDDCAAIARRLQKLGVNEIACLIDFGIDTEDTLAGLRYLDLVREQLNGVSAPSPEDYSIPALIHTHAVTHLQCTPSMARMLTLSAESTQAIRSLKKMMVGGEALPVTLAEQLKELVSGEVHNMYGPTETTIWSTTHLLSNLNGSVPIGRPIANTELYILDQDRQPVPIGVPGELYIGGAGVVRGYRNLPELTSEKFVRNPFTGDSEARLYRTGDLVRYLPDGAVEFIGRADHQVKIRGFRIELGDIESALNKYPNVRQSTVIAREDSTGQKTLVAYLIMNSGEKLAVSMLRPYLQSKLPDYMIPSAFVQMDAFPLTPNGKIDRKALPPPEQAMRRESAAYAAPQSELQSMIAKAWQTTLQIDTIGVDDNFFDLGAHSIMMVQVHADLRKNLGQELSLISMFRFPTIRSLAEFLAQASPAGTPQAGNRPQTRKDSIARRIDLRQRARAQSN